MSIELANRIEFFLSRQLPVRSTQGAPGLAIGTVKGARDDNQDRAAVAFVSFPSGEGVLVALICDGMGGMAEGGEAAGCAASTFISRFAEAPQRTLNAMLLDAISAANNEVYRRFRGNGGTTLTAVAARNNGDTWVAHVGDSRLYQLGPDKALNLITRDDTIGGQLRPPSGGGDDILDNRLLQFVGIGVSIEPHIFNVPHGSRSNFLLTSDGAHSIGKRALEGISKSSANAGELVRKTIYVAEALGVEDNSSAVSISVADFEVARPFSNGTELTIWSPNEKLELWLGKSPSESNENLPRSQARQESSPKQKKAPRVARPKADKKAEILPNEKPKGAEKPQLNIEFGSQDKDNK